MKKGMFFYFLLLAIVTGYSKISQKLLGYLNRCYTTKFAIY